MLDSKPDDWWLVVTIPTDKVPAIKGWVPAASLVATSNNGKTMKQTIPLKYFITPVEAVSQDLEQVTAHI